MRVLLLLLVLCTLAWMTEGRHQYIGWWAPKNHRITYMSATWVVPKKPKNAVYYVWPGVQDGTGVLQSVMDGRKSTWWLGSGWCCKNPSLPWGRGGQVYPGNTAWGTMENIGGGGYGKWRTRSGTWDGDRKFGNNDWDLKNKAFYRSLFDVETYDTNWDFGPIKIRWLVVKSNSASGGWCSNKLGTYGRIGYSIGKWWRFKCGNNCSGCTYKDIRIWNTGSTSAVGPELSSRELNATSCHLPPPPDVEPGPGDYKETIDFNDVPGEL